MLGVVCWEYAGLIVIEYKSPSLSRKESCSMDCKLHSYTGTVVFEATVICWAAPLPSSPSFAPPFPFYSPFTVGWRAKCTYVQVAIVKIPVLLTQALRGPFLLIVKHQPNNAWSVRQTASGQTKAASDKMQRQSLRALLFTVWSNCTSLHANEDVGAWQAS